jgi:cytochrome c-type biogenesis protein CcmF
LWNISLSITNFALCIVATFITRSGMIESVHVFGESVIGFYFLTFLAIIFLLTFGLLIYRGKSMYHPAELPPFFSKIGYFLLTNLIFITFASLVLYGTTASFIVELLGGRKFHLPPTIFDLIGMLLGFIILALMASCQVLGWKPMQQEQFTKTFFIPVILTLIGAGVLWVSGVKAWIPLIFCTMSLFIIVTAFTDFIKTISHRYRTLRQPFGQMLMRTITTQKPRYAGLLVHVGTAVLSIGIAISSTYKLEQEVRLAPGQSATLGGYEFQYKGLSVKEDAQKATVSAEITLAKGDKEITTIIPEKRFYGEGQRQQVTTEIGLRTSLLKDIYVILAGWEEDQTATFSFIIYPLIIWIWIGGFFVFTIGIIITILPRPQKLPEEIEE